jgi:hypothetical protein
MTEKLTVITDARGNVVGTQTGHGIPDPSSEAAAFIVPGPGQALHRIEFEIPRLQSREDIDAFHTQLSDFLRS